MSNWGCLYLILRANFGGLKTEVAPRLAAPREGDGKVEYRSGKRVTGLSYEKDKGVVHIRTMDVSTGKEEYLNTKNGHWGGRSGLDQTVVYFSNRLNLNLMKGLYCMSKIIPTESGRVKPGQRLTNWVWYYIVPEGWPEMAAAFAYIHGQTHPCNVSQGLVRPDVWDCQIARYVSQLIPPLAKAVTKTRKPFVSRHKVRSRVKSGAAS
ncbi:hypothetical protein HRG_012513 [Hirsutella rhossiliensis]